MEKLPPVLISDLDNTLYDFAEYFSPSFRAMVHALARETRVSELQLIRDFAQVYQNHGTIEYTFSVQELPSFSALEPEAMDRLVHIANVAFGRTRRRRLRLYSGVKTTLKHLVAAGVPVCVVTNAPWYSAYRRLHDLGILTLVSGLSAWDGFDVPDNALFKYETAHSAANRERIFATYADDQRKPGRLALHHLLDWIGADRDTFVVGDSIANDLEPAASLGMKTIWAKYGIEMDPRNRQTMLEVTPSTIAIAETASAYTPDYAVDEFATVMEILGVPYQQRLF